MAESVTATQHLCIGSTCVTETQLKALLNQASVEASALPSPNADAPVGSSTKSVGADTTATTTDTIIDPSSTAGADYGAGTATTTSDLPTEQAGTTSPPDTATTTSEIF